MSKITHTDAGNKLTRAEHESDLAHSIGGVATKFYAGALGASAWVVASDAPLAIYNFANMLYLGGYPVWICSGANDDVQIQAAIDALSSGGEISLSLGTFSLSSQIDLASNIILAGMGNSTVLSLDANAVEIELNGLTNVILEKFKIDGNQTGLVGASNNITLWADNTYITIRDITSINAKQDGLYIYRKPGDESKYPQHIRIENYIATNCARTGLSILSGKHIYGENIEAYGNNQDETVAEIDLEPDVATDILEDIILHNAHVHDSTRPGIHVIMQHDSTTQKRVVLDTVDAHDCLHGVAFTGVKDTELINSSLHDNTEGMSLARDIVGLHISHNFIYSNATRGIVALLTSENIDSDEILVENNDIHTNGTGIQIGVSDKTIENLRIRHNQIHDNTNYDILDQAGVAITTDNDFWGSGNVGAVGAIRRDNRGDVRPGDVVTIGKVIDHASLTDNADATAYMDFDDAIPAGSIIKAVECDFFQVFNSDDTSTLTMMIGYVGDLDAFNKTADPGEDAFNHTTDVYWGESDCQEHIVSAEKTPRVTFTEDDDGTDIISSANASGIVTIYITYMKA